MPTSASKRVEAAIAGTQNWLGTAVVAVFMVLLGLALLFGRLPFTSDISSAVNASRSGSQYATGQYMRRLPDGEMCRFTVFDNRKGVTVTDRIVRCDDVRPENERRPTQFNWGGK